MEPLRIRARLLDGRLVSVDGYFPLDTLVAAVLMREQYPELYYHDGLKTHGLVKLPLPFARRGTGEAWYYACSFAQYRQAGEYIAYWHKRFDVDQEHYIDFQGRRGKINTGSGHYRGYRMPVVVQLIAGRLLTWYAVGDRGEIARTLAKVAGIGKKRAYGYGAIDEWEVEPWPHDWSVWGPNGELMRAVPDPDGERVYGIRPPYFYKSVQYRCRMPDPGVLAV